jgi:hypothetical protein
MESSNKDPTNSQTYRVPESSIKQSTFTQYLPQKFEKELLFGKKVFPEKDPTFSSMDNLNDSITEKLNEAMKEETNEIKIVLNSQKKLESFDSFRGSLNEESPNMTLGSVHIDISRESKDSDSNNEIITLKPMKTENHIEELEVEEEEEEEDYEADFIYFNDRSGLISSLM